MRNRSNCLLKAHGPPPTSTLETGRQGSWGCRDGLVLVRLQVCGSYWCVESHAMLKWAGPYQADRQNGSGGSLRCYAFLCGNMLPALQT